MTTDDLTAAFLWNMIALESLLARNRKAGEKDVDVLPERIEAFLGWAGFWATKDFERRIRDAYQVRCGCVHRADFSGVTKELVLFTDELMLNVLTNLTRHAKLFTSHETVARFSDRVKAQQLLGIRAKVRPKSLIALLPKYSMRDYHEI